MSRKFFFYIKSTPKTPKRFKKEIFDKNTGKSKIFRQETDPGCKFMAISDRPSLTWMIRDNFEYVLLFWNRRNFIHLKPDRRLMSGKDVIIVRLVIKGTFMLIIIMTCFLVRIRNKIKKKRAESYPKK